MIRTLEGLMDRGWATWTEKDVQWLIKDISGFEKGKISRLVDFVSPGNPHGIVDQLKARQRQYKKRKK